MSDIKDHEPLWGSWHVDSLLGEGSYGKVYKVKREEFGNVFYAAVKMISIPNSEAELQQVWSELRDEFSVKSHFEKRAYDIVEEIKLMSMFKGNSNIVSIEDYKILEYKEKISWDILIRMELLTTLSYYALSNPLGIQDVIQIGLDISRALEFCHMKHIIHRDIKPENIFVSQYGDYKLGDFGVARNLEHTMNASSKIGTYTYMAPEVFKPDTKYGASIDTYSLGLVMYFYLNNNRSPFYPRFPEPIMPDDRHKALERRMSGEAVPDIPGIPSELNAFILKACAPNPEDRFKDATEFRTELEKLSGTESKPPVTVEVQPEPVKQGHRQRKKVLRQEKDEMTTRAFNLRRNEPEASQESEAKITVPGKIMNILAIAGAVFCGLLTVLSLFSGNRADIFISMPLYALCVVACLLNFRHAAVNTILLVWLIVYLAFSALNFSSFDYVLLSFTLGLLSVESMRSKGRKFMITLSIILFICAATYALIVFISLGESQLYSFRAFMSSAFGIPFLMILSACLLILPSGKRSLILPGIIGLQLFSLTAFIMMIFSMMSSDPSMVIFNIANSCFVGFSSERFSWWRYARFTGLIIQTLAAVFMLCIASARMIPSDFLEFLADKKRGIIVMLVCVSVMASFLYFLV